MRTSNVGSATYMLGMTQQRQPPLAPNSSGGQFATHNNANPDAALPPATHPDSYEVPTVLGTRTVVPGVWDWPTAEAFMNGQCVAFAVAVAPRAGATTIEVLMDVDDNRVIHAWAEDENELLVDASDSVGFTSEEYIADRVGEDWWENDSYLWESIRLDEVHEWASGQSDHNNLPTQAWAAAASVMDAFEVERARAMAESARVRAESDAAWERSVSRHNQRLHDGIPT